MSDIKKHKVYFLEKKVVKDNKGKTEFEAKPGDEIQLETPRYNAYMRRGIIVDADNKDAIAAHKQNLKDKKEAEKQAKKEAE